MTECQICLKITKCLKCENCSNDQCWECLETNGFKCCWCSDLVNKYKLLFDNFDRDLYNKVKNFVDKKFVKFNNDHREKILSMKKHHFSLIYHSEDLMLDLDLDIDECFKRLMIAHIDDDLVEFYEQYLVLKNSVSRDSLVIESISNPEIFSNPNYFTNFFSMLNFYTEGRLLWAKAKNESEETDSCKCRFLNCSTCNCGKYCTTCLEYLENSKMHLCTVKIQNELFKDLKMCPSCNIIVEKKEGCDDMWCIKCKTFFSWRQGIIRNDAPHNPDHRDFAENFFEERMKSEMLQKNYGITNETSFMIDYVCKKAYYEKSFDKNSTVELVDPASKHLIPKFLQEIMIHEIIKLRDYSERSVYTVTKMYDIFKKYKNIIISICGKREFYSKFDYVEDYTSFSIKTSSNRILYARFENDMVEF